MSDSYAKVKVNAYYGTLNNKMKQKLKYKKNKKDLTRVPFINVQICSENVCSKWQKYSRDGSLQYVPVDLPKDEITVDVLKETSQL